MSQKQSFFQKYAVSLALSLIIVNLWQLHTHKKRAAQLEAVQKSEHSSDEVVSQQKVKFLTEKEACIKV